ncbi:hypothetical protein POSPLADRAFT_1049102 [Postia placenta MAD-698-R-SB12]|uniref:Uncharacterized protein n=1 Tax=Postia placenta MAD-698-R-SB12 TaxID=670580 RepID=A0A1X6MRM9_9APHY|nr:hypothetical protein POSPLADRAFT_1049102 [Postia placenta MAD-698-R-SB12]OSX58940.1 hypothetical protein POSPLADRAFT_1049102 [Postia placenta MAD-698-R-SB12]
MTNPATLLNNTVGAYFIGCIISSTRTSGLRLRQRLPFSGEVSWVENVTHHEDFLRNVAISPAFMVVSTECQAHDFWLSGLLEDMDPHVCEANTGDQQSHFRTGLLKLAFSYARLSVLPVGFQYSFGKAAATDEGPFLWRCLWAATDTVKAVVEDIAIPSQKIYLRHGPEAQCVFVTFASAFLVKLLQPKYAQHLSRERRVEIRDLVQRVIDLLSSPEVAIDDRHGPKLYSRFLQGLLATPMARVASARALKTVIGTVLAIAGAWHALCAPIAVSSAGDVERRLQSETGHASATICITSAPASSDRCWGATSMQSITDWPDMVLPGFNWMGSMQQTDFNTNIRYDQPMVGFTHSG